MKFEAWRWWTAAALVFATCAVGLGASDSGLFPGDREALVVAHALRSVALDAVFKNLTWLGSLIVLLPLVAVAAGVLWRRGHRGEAYFLVAALIGAALLARLLKQLVQRPRPELFPALVPVESLLSFPSTHALQATACAVAVLLVLWHLQSRAWRRAASVLTAVVVVVGLSRLYLQVHYPSDVMVGTVAAAGWVLGLRAFMFGRTVARS
ncbi:MAG: phosphatase PAP2 family protein [Sulfuritalea sp.]|nr:phosphatase PAP2 family protein [Sulfuritalea sp.]